VSGQFCIDKAKIGGSAQICALLGVREFCFAATAATADVVAVVLVVVVRLYKSLLIIRL